jgi:hypothetical protein
MTITKSKLLVAGLSLGLLTVAVSAQPFDAKSNGSYGPLSVTAADATLDVPVDGIFHCTTISVAAGRVLRFKRHPMNPPVQLRATGDVSIGGIIVLDGERGNSVTGGLGGPGGFDGGQPGSVGAAPGDGHGPGGGKAGANNTTASGAGGGSYATKAVTGSSTRGGATYGSALLLPVAGGSGGGGTEGTPGAGGGGGGGALLIASNTKISVLGAIRARGAYINSSAWNYGSGGAIRLVAPLVTGTGFLDVQQAEGSGSGGAGRIRVDTQDRSQLNINFLPAATTSVGSMMIVEPTPVPRLDVIEAAGTAIAVGAGPATILLPFGSPAAQTVKVRAKDFSQVVPIRVLLTPDHGASKTYDTEINNVAANPAEVTVNVEFPLNVQTAVEVFTR